jgi:hypothetical protein
MSKGLPSVDEIVELFDDRSEAIVGANQIRLHQEYGLERLVPLYLQAFPRIRNWIGRKYVLFWTRRYARTVPEVVALARSALNDKSWKVRSDACSVLAYALDDASIPELEHLKRHQCHRTRANAEAAIDAIKHRNHNYYLDRDHRGNVLWEVG